MTPWEMNTELYRVMEAIEAYADATKDDMLKYLVREAGVDLMDMQCHLSDLPDLPL